MLFRIGDDAVICIPNRAHPAFQRIEVVMSGICHPGAKKSRGLDILEQSLQIMQAI
jgi:hypothetical protein